MIEIKDKSIFEKRQNEVAKIIKDAALILVSGKESVRNFEVNNKFRVDSNFFYLTGYEEPEAVFVFRPGKTPQRILFVLAKDKVKEQWEGCRFGPESVVEFFAVDTGSKISELDSKLSRLLKGCSKVYYRLGNAHYDKLVIDAVIANRNLSGRSGFGLVPIEDPSAIIGELRVIKESDEIGWIEKACEISSLAITDAMKNVKAGMSENQVEGSLINTYKKHGSRKVAYNPIVASGKNACVLHYGYNNEILEKDDLLLIDAGCEWKYYAGDITRTFPVSGKFSNAQSDFYSHVLKVQKSIIDLAVPGISFEELQAKAVECLSKCLVEMGFKRSQDEMIQTGYKQYYPHKIGHYLGLDTHDAGLYQLNGKPRKLEPGMCITIEPGLYVQADDPDAPKEFLGFGVRIEDDILITENGNKVMTSTPKEIDDIENVMQG